MGIHENKNHNYGRTEKLSETLDGLLKSCGQLEQSMKNFTQTFTDTIKQVKQEMGGWVQAESSFKNSEEKFRLILQNSYDVIYKAHLNTEKFEYISPSSEMIFGYTPDELHAMGFKKFCGLIHPDDYRVIFERAQKSQKENPPVKDLKNEHVIDLNKDENDEVIVRSTVELAHNLGLNVVAEGVEDADTYRKLQQLSCDAAQGYFLSPPLQVKHLEKWLSQDADVLTEEIKKIQNF